MLELRDVSASYGTRLVLNDLSARFDSGQLYALIGMNGAGKTTLIRCILGLKSYQGSITWGGREFGPEDRVACAAFDSAPFHPGLTGRQNLSVLAPESIGGAYCYLPDSLLRKRVSTYSHGERIRLSLTLALNSSAPLVIMDEPTNGLDRECQHRLAQDLREMRGRRTVLMTGHHLEFFEGLVDGAVVLSGGRVVTVGKDDSLVETYQSILECSAC